MSRMPQRGARHVVLGVTVGLRDMCGCAIMQLSQNSCPSRFGLTLHTKEGVERVPGVVVCPVAAVAVCGGLSGNFASYRLACALFLFA